MMSLGEELKSSMPSFMQFCSRVDQGNVQEDWWTAGSDAEAFAHNNKEEWLSDSDSQNTIICSTTSSSPGPSLTSTSTGGGQKVGSSKAKQGSRSKDTPAGQKPAQVVARRNARERRRVQAVNWAFARLRKVVPLEENKSKRMSKVKTLQMAIEYINQLQGVLSLQSPVLQQQQQQQQHNIHPEPEQHHQLLTTADINLFSDIQYKLEPGELQFRMPPNFYTQLLTDNQN
ncbi:helix-loop-helix protein 2 isoform X1 [Acyrthosiphon pisum]|uniref:BHLH domain-containing protein n=1 Tax=Acyrthosiphon pisum TaxID=7029 RepID=A0A8R2A406_ACYPI|nr:helix-loop-helix protein 2 isoform X1 [Acyrthosiphon pisum]|eukprot:XP_001949172.2 PREDICTED: helix-loop-helix protein 2 isoform X1 [Acyrthosiphon pisum]